VVQPRGRIGRGKRGQNSNLRICNHTEEGKHRRKQILSPPKREKRSFITVRERGKEVQKTDSGKEGWANLSKKGLGRREKEKMRIIRKATQSARSSHP